MKNVNRVTLLGFATRDAELKTVEGGTVCNMGLATNRVWKDAKGEIQSLPEFHSIVCWGKFAEFCGQYVKKGKPLYIEGYLKTHGWEQPAGVKHFRTEVMAQNVVLLGSKEHGKDAVAEETEDETETEAVAA